MKRFRFLLVLLLSTVLQAMQTELIPDVPKLLESIREQRIIYISNPTADHYDWLDCFKQALLGYSNDLDFGDRISLINDLSRYPCDAGNITKRDCADIVRDLENKMCRDFKTLYITQEFEEDIKNQDMSRVDNYLKLFKSYRKEKKSQATNNPLLNNIISTLHLTIKGIGSRPVVKHRSLAGPDVILKDEPCENNPEGAFYNTVFLTENLQQQFQTYNNLGKKKSCLVKTIAEYSQSASVPFETKEKEEQADSLETKKQMSVVLDMKKLQDLCDQLQDVELEHMQCQEEIHHLIQIVEDKNNKALYDKKMIERRKRELKKQSNDLQSQLQHVITLEKDLSHQEQTVDVRLERAGKARFVRGQVLAERDLATGAFQANLKNAQKHVAAPIKSPSNVKNIE